MAEPRGVDVRRLGLIEYAEADALMRELQTLRLADEIPDTLLLCEHPEIVTIGPGARRDKVVVPSDYVQTDVDRGGGITYHGPGQMVVYPVFRWDFSDEANVKRITSKLEQWAIGALSTLGVEAGTDDRMQGIWLDGQKVGSVGLAFMRWVSRHGFTINLATDEGRVEGLHGCGMDAGLTTSLSTLGHTLKRDDLEMALLSSMGDCLNRFEQKP